MAFAHRDEKLIEYATRQGGMRIISHHKNPGAPVDDTDRYFLLDTTADLSVTAQ